MRQVMKSSWLCVMSNEAVGQLLQAKVTDQTTFPAHILDERRGGRLCWNEANVRVNILCRVEHRILLVN